MKFWEINSAVKAEMRLDPGLVEDSERARFINDCMSDIGALQLIELEYIDSACFREYPFVPEGLTKLKALYWDDKPLKPMTADNIITSTGTPIGYVVEAGKIRLYPVPAQQGVLRWIYTGTPQYCTEADITDENSTVEPQLPSTWHRLVVDYTCFRSHRKNGNIIMANMYRADYDKSLADKIREYVSYLNSQITQSRSPEVNAGWWD